MIADLKERIGLEIETNKNPDKWQVYEACKKIVWDYEAEQGIFLNSYQWKDRINYITNALQL